MKSPFDLSPLQRQALLAAAASGDNSLVRCGRHYIASNAAPGSRPHFTLRLLRKMDRDYLFHLDDDIIPSRARLTSKGSRLAAMAANAAVAKAVA